MLEALPLTNGRMDLGAILRHWSGQRVVVHTHNSMAFGLVNGERSVATGILVLTRDGAESWVSPESIETIWADTSGQYD